MPLVKCTLHINGVVYLTAEKEVTSMEAFVDYKSALVRSIHDVTYKEVEAANVLDTPIQRSLSHVPLYIVIHIAGEQKFPVFSTTDANKAKAYVHNRTKFNADVLTPYIIFETLLNH